MEYEIGMDEYDFTVRVTDYTAYRPGKYTGPWENSYPDEPEEVEWELVDGMIYDENGENPRMLTAEELKQAEVDHAELIESILLDRIHEDQQDDLEY